MTKRKTPIPLYFTALEIENVRCFGDRQRLDLTAENGRPARWTLILGENGVGKTTLLQCLAWMRLVPVNDDPALLAEENEILETLLRKDRSRELTLGAKLSLGATLSSTAERAKDRAPRSKTVSTSVQLFFDAKRLLSEDRPQKSGTTFTGQFPDPVVVAYGANRQRGVDNLAKGDLDDPTAASRLTGLTELYDVEKILRDLDYTSKKRPTGPEKQQLERLQKALANILPGDEFKPSDIEIYPPDVLDSGEPSGVHVKTFSGLVPMSALSLGYQTTLAWVADFAWRLLKRYPGSDKPLEEPAMVLIDEIDLHLHPLWQLRIIDDLTAIFPGTQFVATSHSPLMVQVAEDANFVLLRKRETDVEIVNDPEVVRNWRVDQILTSELFDLPRARNKDTENLFKRRDELVQKKESRSADEEAELKQLRVKISELPTAQDPEAERAMMDFIRKAEALLAKHKVVEP